MENVFYEQVKCFVKMSWVWPALLNCCQGYDGDQAISWQAVLKPIVPGSIAQLELCHAVCFNRRSRTALQYHGFQAFCFKGRSLKFLGAAPLTGSAWDVKAQRTPLQAGNQCFQATDLEAKSLEVLEQTSSVRGSIAVLPCWLHKMYSPLPNLCRFSRPLDVTFFF